jgi:nucleotide-binding universal stress UspA family protein
MTDSQRDRVLLALDGSEHALQAVRYAGRMLDPRRFEAVLFHILTRVPDSFWDIEQEPAYQYRIVNISAWEAQQEKAVGDYMERAKSILLDAGFPEGAVQIKIQERKAGIARDIVAESQEGYRAVVLGRRGMSDLKDFMLGSIATKIIEKIAHIPIWIIGGTALPGKMLLCVDSSEGAMLAVDHAALVLGEKGRVEIGLFHAVRGYNVFQKVFHEALSADQVRDFMESVRKESAEAAGLVKPALDAARARLTAAGIDNSLVGEKVASGSSSRAGAIVEEAEKGGYDTIVVGRRGLSRVQEFFMGRVGNKVIHLAKDKAVWIVS